MRIFTLLKQIGIVVVLVVLAWIPIVNAATIDPYTEKMMDTLLTAIATNNYDLLMANAGPNLKSGNTMVTKEGFMYFTGQEPVARIKKGYKLQYLSDAKKRGVKCFLWKISLQDGDDLLGYLWIQEGKIAGFLFENPLPPAPH